ncbi:MAG: Si-specific NAD(P)(+) transhydrogenase, partial [Planctomycetes bacterium]|nr:Si-specific NAD(P)(+) transhydrogenase [Planctomycetota bacterium]
MADNHYDLIVIGSGPAGHKAAIQGSVTGKRVLLVERAKGVGGECVRHGTIPSKSLRETAVQLSSLRGRLLDVARLELTEQTRVDSLMTRLDEVTSSHDHFLTEQLTRNHVEFRHGRARFLSDREIEVQTVRGEADRFTADYFVIAVGSRPRTPADVPVDHEHILDSDSWLSLNYLPRSLIVLGSGVIACEYASTFASLGVEVTLVDKWPAPLGFLDRRMSRFFVERFETNRGCEFLGEQHYTHIQWDGVSSVRMFLESGRILEADKLLCALGRVANIAGLGLEDAGVELSDRGHVAVDEFGRTSVPHIYAAGDVIGPPALASTSAHQGRRAVRHAFGLPLGSPPEMIPAGLFTIPEISTIGLTEAQAVEQHGGAICGEADFAELARAQINRTTDGYLQLVSDPTGRKVLGVHVIGEGATELIHVAQVAMLAGLEVDSFIETIFNFPTLSEAYRVAAL